MSLLGCAAAPSESALSSVGSSLIPPLPPFGVTGDRPLRDCSSDARTILAVASEISASSVARVSSTTAMHLASLTSDGLSHVFAGIVGTIQFVDGPFMLCAPNRDVLAAGPSAGPATGVRRVASDPALELPPPTEEAPASSAGGGGGGKS